MSLTTTYTESEPLPVTIVDAVAEVTGLDPHDVPVLQETVDVDALCSLVAPKRRSPVADVVIRFDLADCVVEVSSTGVVSVMEATRSADEVTTDRGSETSRQGTAGESGVPPR